MASSLRVSNSRLGISSVRLCLGFLAGLTFSSLLPRAQAQAPDISTANGQTQTPIPGSGHDYQHLLAETVDPSNGSVNFKISFPVAKGRGITIPYAWSYSSAAVNPLNMLNGNTPQWDDKAIQSGPEWDGWNTLSGIPYAAVSVWNQTPPPNQNQTFAGCNIQSGMTFTDMSGTLHNLYTAAESTASTQSGLVQTCGTQSYMPANGDGQVIAKPDPNTGINNLPGSNPSSGSFVVTDKNGTNYSFPGIAVPQSGPQFLLPSIEDRNGNTLGPPPEGSNALYTDSAGRLGPVVTDTSVTINSGTPDQLVFTSVGESVPSTYSLGTLSTGDQAEGVTCAGLIPTSVNGTRSAIKSLTLPNGEGSYQFWYGEYGLLDEIKYPDGGYVIYNWELPPGTGNAAYNQIAFWSGSQLNENENGTYYYTPVPYGCSQLYQAPVLYSRSVSFDGSTIALSQIYSYSTTWASDNGEISGWSAKTTTVTTTDEKTGLTSSTVYNYIPWGTPPQPYASLVVAPSFPIESEIDYSDWGQTAITRKVNKTWYDQFNLASETTTIVKTGQVSKTVYTYVNGLGSSPSSSSFVYLSKQQDYDYSSSSTPIKTTIYNYRNPVAMPTNFPTFPTYTESTDEYPMMLPALVSSVTVENGSGAIQEATEYTYDGSALTSVSPTQHDTNYGTSMTTRGNLTSVTRCNPVPSSAGGACSGSTVSYAYDTSGQPTSMTDANGNTTTYSFADSFSDDSSAPSTNAYLTSVTYPSNLSESFEYSYYLGYVTSSKDENGQTTTYSYGTEASKCTAADSMFRLTEIDAPVADGGKTQYCYSDTAPSPTVKTWKLINASSSPQIWEESIATMDGMEHVVETQLMTDPGGADNVFTTYNGEGKVFTVSNPTRLSSPPANTTTTNYYDVFGRPIETKAQDGSIRQWCYDDLASSPAVANCSVQAAGGGVTTGTWVDSTDENGNHWQHTSDVFGRLTEVMEPNGASQSPSMETDYTYDILSDLLSVKQCGALCSAPATNGPISRSFSYNSLAQLVTGTNPETGTESYTYDLNGNVLTKVSPALNGNTGTQTLGYCYDPLNRLVGKWSASPPTGCNSTPTTASSTLLATYKFGGTSDPTYHTGGRLIDARSYLNSTLVADDTPSQYDAMGRLLLEGQCLSSGGCSTPFYVNNTYDQAGDLTFTDNGLSSLYTDLGFTFTYDGAQHMSVAQTTTESPNFPTSTYPPVLLQANGGTSNPSYDAWGHLINGQMGLISVGTGTPVIQTTRTFDNRGRVITETDGSFYSFTVQNGSGSGYDSVGNLKYYQDSVMGNWTYSYDTLNRLTTAQDTATTSVSTQFANADGCWTYDGFGNRTKEALSNVTSTPCANGVNDNLQLTVTTPTSKNQATGFTYDLAGNVLYDNSNHYLYDAEGRLCAVEYPNGTGTSYEQYIYDASGARVGKGMLTAWPSSCNAPTLANGYTATNLYLLGLGGEQVTELNGGGTILHTNVFAGGKLQATYDFNGSNNGAGLHFALADMLGTKRVQVLAAGVGLGTVELQCMSLPFGNGLGNPRVTDCVGSATDATEHHFTGKDRDTESGNDYFGARYYSSAMGRFMTPDWSAKVEPVPYSKLDNPQTLNLYSYVMNNPLTGVDADGHAPLSWGGFVSCGEEDAAIGCGAGSQTAAGMAEKSASDAQANREAQDASPQKGSGRERGMMAAEGIANVFVGVGKISVAAKLGATSEVAGPLAPLAILGAAYAGVTGTVQTVQGLVLLGGAATGYTKQAQLGVDALGIVASGSGFTAMLISANMATANRWGALEGVVTGAAQRSMFDSARDMVDALMNIKDLSRPDPRSTCPSSVCFHLHASDPVPQ